MVPIWQDNRPMQHLDWQNPPRAGGCIGPQPAAAQVPVRYPGHQQIGVKLFPIIGFTPQLLAIIAYYSSLILLLLLFGEKFCYSSYWLLLNHAQTLIIAIIPTLLLQLINFC
jgi:hypothetical protein